jgi:hypothetical protein
MKVMLTAEVSSCRGPTVCRVLDISRGGACLDANSAHEVGEEVAFKRGTLQAKARIVWSRGKRFGIQFNEPIRATELLVQMSHSRAAATPSQRAAQLSAAVPIPA